MVLKVGSLSSGYAGLEMALSAWLGAIDVRWHAEIDADASLVLKTWWPEVPNLGSFADEDFWERAERVHLMCGGIPCQPFSAAGPQLGKADPRYLWPFWQRGIELHRPATIVFENVKRLIEGEQRPIFDEIIADLLALGYDVRWCLLGACAVGAAHHRHRVFLLACRTRLTPNARRVPWACTRRGEALLPSPRAVDAERGPARASRNQDLGRRNGPDLAQVVANMLPARAESSAGSAGQGIQADSIVQWGRWSEAVARHAAVLGRPAPEPTEIGPKGGRRLAAAFSEWLMMLPEGHLTSVLDRNPALARAGNGVVPLQAATALRLLYADLRAA